MSGKVRHVHYRPEHSDAYHQRYTYDHDGRVVLCETSRDGIVWVRDASYAYELHGPLRRIEIGQDSVQGIDYTYTINGWLKSINHPSSEPTMDAGRDGKPGTAEPHALFGRDAFGMMLTYHADDFKHTGSFADAATTTAGNNTWHQTPLSSLYNGNIAAWSWSSRTNTGTPQPLASRYRYDVLNRIRVDTLSTRASSVWQPSPNYRSSYTYDGNGNLKNLVRVDSAGTLMDSLLYTYQPNRNRLTHVDDPGGVAGNHSYDVDDQQADNYTYDATGNLISDTQEGITSIEWTPSNKVRSITKGSTSKLEYTYDAMGNRVVKRFYKPATTLKHTTWYARDAQGNVLSIYERPLPTSDIMQTEVHIYGSSRIGIEQRNITYSTSPFAWLESEQHRHAGTKRYELTDHLGNVRVTISDLLVPRPASSFGYVTQDAEVIDRRDYYPFGMEMPGRRWRATGEDAARFGFNGKENDNEVKGEGNQQDYGFRIYDPRVARFLSVDPLSSKFPWNSTYAFAENDVVRAIDLEGLERLIVITRLWDQKVRLMPAKEISRADQARMQANFFLRHPSAALEIGWIQRGSTNISSIAGRMARHMAVHKNMTSEEGSESNGFRHVLWQAMITAQYGRAVADEAGRAHEGVGYWEQTDIDWQAAPLQDPKALDQLVDVLNNEIGRRIGEKHPEASNKQLAILVLDKQKNKGVWRVEKGRDGALRVAKRTISDEQYQTARKELDRLDDTGMSAEERAAVAND